MGILKFTYECTLCLKTGVHIVSWCRYMSCINLDVRFLLVMDIHPMTSFILSNVRTYMHA